MGWFNRDEDAEIEALLAEENPKRLSGIKLLFVAAATLVALPAGYWGAGQVFGTVNTEPLATVTVPKNVSHISKAMERIMDRELSTVGWSPSEAINISGTRIDTPPHQRGVFLAVNLMMRNYYDDTTHYDGEAHTTPDLDSAHQAFTVDQNKWQWTILNPAIGDTATVLTNGVKSLKAYNDKMAKGEVRPLEYNITTAAHFVARIDMILSQTQEMLESQITQGEDGGNFLTNLPKDAVTSVKSLAYRGPAFEAIGAVDAVAELVKAGGQDFKEVIGLQSTAPQYRAVENKLNQLVKDYGKLSLVINTPIEWSSASHIRTMAGDIARIRIALRPVYQSLAAAAR